MVAVEIEFFLFILCAPFAVAVLTDKDREDIDEKALLIGRMEVARIYTTDGYKEFRDRPDLRSVEEYMSTFYRSQDESKGTAEEKKVNRMKFEKLRESVYAVFNAYVWMSRTGRDRLDDETRREFRERLMSHRLFLQRTLENHDLLQWPRVVYDCDTKVLTVIPEKFLPKDMAVESEIDYVGESRLHKLRYIKSEQPLSRPASVNFDFIENLADEVKKYFVMEFQGKIRFAVHHIIPTSHTMTLANSIFPLVNYVESRKSNGYVLWTNRKAAALKVLFLTNSGNTAYFSEIEPNFQSLLTRGFLDGSGNLFYGPVNREDNPGEGFDIHSEIIFPSRDIYLKLRVIYDEQIEMIKRYSMLEKNANMDEDAYERLLKELLDRVKDLTELNKFSREFRESLIEQERYNNLVSNFYRLTGHQSIPFDPTMWVLSETGRWRLRTVEDRNAQYIPDWLENVIENIETDAGVAINRTAGPKRVSDLPKATGATHIFDRNGDEVFIYSDPRAVVRTSTADRGLNQLLTHLAESMVERDRPSVETELNTTCAAPTRNLVICVRNELKKENPNPRLLNILRPPTSALHRPTLVLRPPIMTDTLTMRMLGTPEGENDEYSLAAPAAMIGVALCHVAQENPIRPRRDYRYSTSYSDNALVNILTFGSADGRAINETIYRQLVTEYQSLPRDVRSDVSFLQYIENEIVNGTSSSLVRNVILDICSKTTTPTASTTTRRPVSSPPSQDSGHSDNCKRKVIIGSTLGATLGGCGVGAAVGTFFFPGVGTAIGCGIGTLIGGATGLLGSQAVVLKVCE